MQKNSPFYHVLNTVVVNNATASAAATTASNNGNIAGPSDRRHYHHRDTNDKMLKYTKENHQPEEEVKQSDEYSSLPDNLKMIISKTWASCSDEDTENIPPPVMKPISDNTHKTHMQPNTITSAANTPIVCTCQPNKDILTTATQLPTISTTSPDSGLGYEHHLVPRDRVVPRETVRQPFMLRQHNHHQQQQPQPCIQASVIPKPRPLVRQKEDIDANLFLFFPPTLLTSSTSSTTLKSVNGTGDSINIHNNNNQVIPTISSQQMTSSAFSSTSTATINTSISNANYHHHNNSNNDNIKSTQAPVRHPFKRKQDAIYNARYKTQPCVHYQKYKHCPLGDNCHFAHGPEDLKHPQSHPKYRTRICTNYSETGDCPFGNNCYFLHKLPTVTPLYHHQLQISNNNNNHDPVNTTINHWNGQSFTGQQQMIMANIHNNVNGSRAIIDSVLLRPYLRQVAI
ncbi:unnamed protein product [Trichobilharzia szidati]|nr:unnamed protein product [Trichobilharzia szidati]